MGKRSGAHFNPAITLAYFRLRKIARWDAVFYVVFQFVGGVLGVAVAAVCFGSTLAKPTVEYAVTVPGKYGTAAAFSAELFMAALLMGVVLWMTNRPSLATYTSYSVGCADRTLHPILRSSVRLQHQSGSHNRFGSLRGHLDGRMALLCRPAAWHVDLRGDLLANLRRGSNLVREIASRSALPVPVSVQLSGSSPHAQASRESLNGRPNRFYDR